MRQPISKRPTRFFLMSTQRTGSTWITDLLNSHPNVASYTELLLEIGRGLPEWGRYRDVPYWNSYKASEDQASGKRLRPALLFRYLDGVFRNHPNKGAIGLKVMYSQAYRLPEILAYIRWRRISLIHLVRRNSLDIVLSGLAKDLRARAHATTASDIEAVRLNIDVQALVHQIGKLERQRKVARAALRSLAVPYYELVYEDVASDPAAMDAAIDFLGLAPVALTSGLRKLNPQSHRDLIENYEDVRRALEKTRFGEMLR